MDENGELDFEEGEVDTETSAEKFVRIGERRLAATAKQLELMQNLGAYEHTEEQTHAIVATLQLLVNEVERALKPKAARVLPKL